MSLKSYSICVTALCLYVFTEALVRHYDLQHANDIITLERDRLRTKVQALESEASDLTQTLKECACGES